MRALIVEDSPVVRKVIMLKLRQSGITVEEMLEAADGEQALDLIRKAEAQSGPLGLILCDLNTPVLDGLAFIDRLRPEGLCARTLIVITTELKEATVLRALASGVSGYKLLPANSSASAFSPSSLPAKPRPQPATQPNPPTKLPHNPCHILLPNKRGSPGGEPLPSNRNLLLSLHNLLE